MTDFVSKVVEFNEVAGTKAEFNARKLGLYIGLILEETQELVREVAAISKDPELNTFAAHLTSFADDFKKGKYDAATYEIDRTEILDAAVDIAVVSIGAGISVGSDISGALNEVADNNLSKFPLVDGVRTVLKDANGKVMKPEGYQKPQLSQFLK